MQDLAVVCVPAILKHPTLRWSTTGSSVDVDDVAFGSTFCDASRHEHRARLAKQQEGLPLYSLVSNLTLGLYLDPLRRDIA